MPVSSPQLTPNAVKFAEGTGTTDRDTGAVSLSWTGSYTVNAYPAQFNAPNEIYSNPQLTLDGDGAGALTMNFALGAGVDMTGNPTPAQDFGRITLQTYSSGSAVDKSLDSFRITPDYKNVTVTVPADGSAQTTTCTTDGGATGWWGSWPQQFITDIPASVRPHFYSTGCGGMQDNKPGLPADVDLGLDIVPTVVVSDVDLLPSGQQAVTVTGTGFDPSLAIGTRPPFSGKQSGLYIAFGRYLETWRPSTGAPSTSRKNPSGANGNGVAVKWAVPAATFTGSGQDPANAAYTVLGTDGSFSTTIQVDQSWLSAEAGNFGIYTYAGGGPTVASYETYTPITFTKATPTVTLDSPSVAVGTEAVATVTVASEGGTTGAVTLTTSPGVTETKDLVAGSATFSLGDELAAGTYPLSVAFEGNANSLEGSDTSDLVVTQHASSSSLAAPATFYGTVGTATVTVASATGSNAGSVTLKRGTTTVGTADVVAGKATFTLGKLAAGSHPLTATYAGNASTAGSTATFTYKVSKAKSATAVTVSKKPTSSATGKAVVTVTSPTTVPVGQVSGVLKGGGKTIKTFAASGLASGKRTVTLPKLAKGTYKLVLTYAGNANTAGSTKTVTFTVK